MRTLAQQAGDQAEERVAAQLQRVGWTLLGTHVRVGRAELDLVMLDPGPPAAVVIVEVRWRARRDFGLPEETIDHRKLARLRRAGFALQAGGSLPDGTKLPRLPIRVDLVAHELGRRLRHHRHVG